MSDIVTIPLAMAELIYKALENGDILDQSQRVSAGIGKRALALEIDYAKRGRPDDANLVLRLRAENARIRGALTDIKAEAFQREAIPGPKSSKDEIRGASMALSARLSSVERLCRSALKAKEARE